MGSGLFSKWLILKVALKIRFNILCFHMKLSFLPLASSGFSFLCFPVSDCRAARPRSTKPGVPRQVSENWTAW